MQEQLEVQRRILISAYRRYLVADRALEVAQIAALAWLPEAFPSKVMLIGDAGSPVRGLYDRRDHALARLAFARQELQEAQRRLRRHRFRTTPGAIGILLS